MDALLAKQEGTWLQEEKEKVKAMLSDRSFATEIDHAVQISGVDWVKAYYALEEHELRKVISAFRDYLETTHHIFAAPGIKELQVRKPL